MSSNQCLNSTVAAHANTPVASVELQANESLKLGWLKNRVFTCRIFINIS